MSLINFTINNKNSLNDFNIIVKNSNHENKIMKRYESIPIPGKIGNLIIPEEGKDNQIIDIEAVVKLGNTSPFLFGNLLEQWLRPNNNYQHLNFNDGFQFEAILKDKIEITRGKCNTRVIKLQFEAKPIDPTSIKYVIANESNKVVLTDDTKGIEVSY